ncbi:FxSxx-COOH system tetratricopeptide repeat protein [Kutzneria buriramensis]|uniref:FxSxx-COOH system tetratricopeptide repeat protein n=1 Tax=Kutzneria buriramensis TaxID=1045776 RepID=UPI0024821F9E|nr:FxSxx-COOH system tetratricopeptide repeat protein [Kutzneria buriramensis]
MADGLWLACQRHRAMRAGRPDAAAVPPPATRERVPPGEVPETAAAESPDTGERSAQPDAATAATVETVAFPVVRAVDRPDGDGTRLDLPLGRALGPLKQVIPSTRDRELDEETTAEWALTDDRWLPVFRPADERRWEVVVVVDDNPTMAVWWDTAMAFGRVLVRQGVFRNVQVRLLGIGPAGECTIRGTGAGAPHRSPRELIEPSGRRIVLVLTDGCSALWQNGSAQAALHMWGSVLPIALVHLLPWQMWRQTAIEVHRLQLKAPAPGACNASLRWEQQVDMMLVDEARRARAIPVPVLELQPNWLAAWARIIVGKRASWTNLPALLVDPDVTAAPSSAGDTGAEPARRVAEFHATVSPVAFELATYLAAAPLNLGVIERVRQVMLPDSRRSHLSEILASGLLMPMVPREEVADRTRETFGFVPGVREELLASGRQSTTVRAMRLAEEWLADSVPAIRGYGNVLDRATQRDDEHVVTAETVPFLTAEAAVLEALSGPHLAAAARLRRQLAGHHTEVGGESSLSRIAPRGSTVPTTHSRTSFPPHTTIATRPGDFDVTRTEPGAQIRSGAQQVVWGGVPPRNPNFTGREELLRELDDCLAPGATAAVLPQALHGMGGVGKSQLAVEYAYRHQNDFDLIWWIPAERSVQIQSSLVELGQRLDLGVGAEANVAVQRVIDALRGGPGRQVPPNWLLVFDNAEDPEEVLSFLPTGGPGRILVTSRNSRWLTMARGLEVDVFEREESKALLGRRGPDITDDEADRLAEALGDLPLAVEQAAAWRAETGMPADEYLELLNEKLLELLNMSQPADYGRPVAAAWNLSLEQLENRNPAGLRLLQLAAFLAPEPIARSMFSNGRGLAITPDLDRALRDRLRLNEAIRDINRFALARIDHRTNSIQMHRLVQQVLINQMTEVERQTMRHGAHLLLAASDPYAPADSDQWPRYAELYPHVTTSEAIKCDDPGVRDLAYNLAVYLSRWGDHRAATDLSQAIYDTWRDGLGDEHRETLRIGRWLGFMLWSDGRYEEAATLDNRILEICVRVLGEQHEGTVDAMNNVAGDLRAQGEFDSALALSEDIHTRSVRSFGDDDPLTLSAAHNLGVSLRLAGRFADAREIDDRTWRRKVEIFGTDHALSILTQIGLALDARELGDYVVARTMQEDIVARLRQIHGEVHPQTVAAIRLLAEMRRKAGDHEGALEAADEAVRGLTARHNEYHPEAMAASLCLSVELRCAGNLGAARQLADSVVERYRTRLGAGHPHTLAAIVNQAVVLRLLGERESAKTINETAAAGLRDRLGPEHPSTLVADINLASTLWVLNDVTGARQLDTRTLAACHRQLGPEHPTTLACMVNLAQDLLADHETEQAWQMHDEAVRKIEQKLGAKHAASVEFAAGTQRANCDIDPLPL